MEFIREIKSMLFITAGFYLIIGFLMLLAPTFVSNSICYLIGAFCLILGGLFVYIYIGSEVYGPLAYGMLLTAIALISLGVFIVLMPETFASFIPLVMGLILAIDGFTKLLSASSLKRYNDDKWWHIFVLGLLIFALGILVMVYNFNALILFIRILGAVLLIDAGSSILTALNYGKIEKAIK